MPVPRSSHRAHADDLVPWPGFGVKGFRGLRFIGSGIKI